MDWEYRVEEEHFGTPKQTEDHLNAMALEGWEHYQISTSRTGAIALAVFQAA